MSFNGCLLAFWHDRIPNLKVGKFACTYVCTYVTVQLLCVYIIMKRLARSWKHVCVMCVCVVVYLICVLKAKVMGLVYLPWIILSNFKLRNRLKRLWKVEYSCKQLVLLTSACVYNCWSFIFSFSLCHSCLYCTTTTEHSIYFKHAKQRCFNVSCITHVQPCKCSSTLLNWVKLCCLFLY